MSHAISRTLGWSLTRPCVFDGYQWRFLIPCEFCRNTSGIVMVENTRAEYDVEVAVRILPGYGSIIPRGEYAPIDPPEPPECEILSVRFAGSDACFPWDLSEEEQHEIERAALEEEW